MYHIKSVIWLQSSLGICGGLVPGPAKDIKTQCTQVSQWPLQLKFVHLHIWKAKLFSEKNLHVSEPEQLYSTWTMNFQMLKLDLEKAEEPEIKLPPSTGSHTKQEFQKNICFCFIDYTKAFDCVDHNKLWKILQEMGILDHLTCLLRNLYAGQEATVRTGHGTTDWFQIGKGAHQGYILSPCLFNLHAEYIM